MALTENYSLIFKDEKEILVVKDKESIEFPLLRVIKHKDSWIPCSLQGMNLDLGDIEEKSLALSLAIKIIKEL